VLHTVVTVTCTVSWAVMQSISRVVFISVSWGGVRLSSLGMPATKRQLYQPG
jgi:hypothetical protein